MIQSEKRGTVGAVGLGYWTHEPDGSLPLAQLERPIPWASPQGRPLYIHTSRPNFSQPSSRIALVYQSFFSRTIADRLYYDWMVEKNMDGNRKPIYKIQLLPVQIFSPPSSRIALVYQSFCSRTIADQL